MADPIAEAFVRIRPDLTGFDTAVQKQVDGAIKKVRLTPGAQQNVSSQLFGTGFVRDTKTRMTGAVKGGTDVPDAVQRTMAQKLFGPGFRNESGRALQGALSGLGGGQLAAQFAFFGPGGAALAVLGGALLGATTSAAIFEQSLDVLQATSGATTEEMAALSKQALELGADISLPAVTAQSAADAMTELAKAGLTVQDSLAGARGVLQLATAANISAAEAAQIVANALNAFGLAGDQAVRVADDLANAANAAQGSIGDFALAMKQVAAVANQVGLSLEDTTSLLTLLAKRGLQGSDAGTSLRVAFIRLIAPTERANKLITSLGLAIRDAQGNFRTDVFAQFREATEGLGPAARDAAAALIFGQDAIRAVAIAGAEGARGLQLARLEIDQQGTAAQLAAARTKGLAGSFQGLVSNAQTTGVSIGEFTQGPLQALTDGLSRAIFELNLLATGDFGGFAEAFGEDAQSNAANFERRLRGISDLSQALFSQDTEQLRKGLSELFQQAPAQPDRIQLLLEDLDALQKLRIESFAVGIDIGPITDQIKQIRALLKEARVDAGDIIPVTELEKKLEPLRTALRSALDTKSLLASQGGDIAAIGAIIDGLRARIKVTIQASKTDIASVVPLTAEQIRRNIETVLTSIEADPTGPLAGKLVQQLSTLIGKLKDRGKLSAGAAREIGERFMAAIGEGITANEQLAIDAAREALQRVREEGDKQVQEAIRSARANLESLGQTIGQDLADLIDVGPIGQAIDKINEQLDRLQERTSRRQLRFDVGQAEKELRDLQFAIGGVGKLTPAQKKSQDEILAPAVEKVADAKAAFKEFDLTETRDELVKTKDAATKAADEGIQKLIARFEAGKVSAGEFNRLLRRQLGPAFDILKTKGGQNLGLIFTRDFKRDVQTLLEQAQELKAFFPLGGGTTPGTQVVRPSDTQAQVNARIADAVAALAKAQSDAVALTKEEKDILASSNKFLRQIRDAVSGGPKSRAPGRGPKS